MSEAVKAGDLLAGAMARFEQMAAEGRERGERWRTWAAGQSARTCRKHGVALPIDEDASLRASRDEMTIVPKPCPDCVKEGAEIETRARLMSSGVPANLAHATLDNWTAATDEAKHALVKVRDFAARGRGFLVLMGRDYGIGKSHLAVAVMRVVRPARFLSQNQLLLKLRATYRDDRAEDIVEACKRVRLLVVDEVGLSGGGRDELPMLHEILNHRHGAMKPTVLTSNLEKDEFVAALGERMIDRLRESAFASITLHGKSHRPERRANYHQP